MTRPRSELIDFVKTLEGPLLIVGAAGKMGPTFSILARRAAQTSGHDLQIIAASRFSQRETQQALESAGIRTISCDMLDREAVNRLPDAPNVIYLVGLKFGTQTNPSLTWAVNTLAPAHVSERFRQSRIVALSTGNVYPLVPKRGGGAVETAALTPLGEYANAAIARERLFEYHARKNATRMVLLRLNYAVDLRYGVLLEIAEKVWTGKPVDVTTGYLNCIWQGDANEFILRSLELATTPPAVFNVTGAQILSVRELAHRFGELMNRPVEFFGAEADTALLSNTGRFREILGEPPTPLETLLRWVAHWVMRSGRTLGKPTRFEVRDGQY